MINKVMKELEKLNINYEIVYHDPIYTMEEMKKLNLKDEKTIAKNLFLRDDKKRNYYLLSIFGDKTVNLKNIKEKIGSRPLSFASENDLYQFLSLTKGSVTPLGILNDKDKKVKVYIDNDFKCGKIGIHPNENTATVWLNSGDLIKLIEYHGNSVEWMKI